MSAPAIPERAAPTEPGIAYTLTGVTKAYQKGRGKIYALRDGEHPDAELACDTVEMAVAPFRTIATKPARGVAARAVRACGVFSPKIHVSI